MLWIWLLACTGADPSNDDPVTPPDQITAPDDDGSYELLPPRLQAIRASMALRGVRPTASELASVEADPAALAALVDAWLDDPRLGQTVRDLYAEVLKMRSIDLVYPQLGPLANLTQQQIRDALSEEPLALIEHVVLTDKPFTEIVTADYSFLDETGAKIWTGHDYPPGATGSRKVRWLDGRPAGGILSTNALWARHPSAGTNYHRGRANLVADALLCEDFLDRDVPISGDLDLADDDAVASALLDDPACVSCHQALDPLASHLWVMHPEYTPGAVGAAWLTGCAFPFLELCPPFNPYRPAYDLGRLALRLRPPGYYGADSAKLDTLGANIAADPRFSSCTARRFWSHLAQRPIDQAPFQVTARLQQRFIASGWSARALLRDIVLSPEFLAIDRDGDRPTEAVPGPLIVRPWQHQALVEQLTGFRYRVGVDDLICRTTGLLCYGDVDLATDDVHGYDAMSGGFDGARVQRPAHTATPVKLLFAAALAEEAAAYVVREDLALAPARRRLLKLIDAETRDEADVRAQLAALHDAVLAEPDAPDSEAVALSWTLWSSTVARTDDPIDGWRAVLAAMLQDPAVLYY